MKATPLTADEVDDFYALNIAIEADFVPDEPLARAIREGRVQRAASSSSMGTAETFWYALARDAKLATARQGAAVVPPGLQAADWPYEAWADDRDVDGLLWAPFRSEQELSLAGAMPEARAPIARKECLRILAALDMRYRGKEPRPKDRELSFEKAFAAVMKRIDGFASETLDKRVLRFEILRTLVRIAWDRPWRPVDVNAAWWD